MPGGNTCLDLGSVPAAGSRYTLGECIGSGVRANVYEATDSQSGNRKVAVKVQRLTPDTETYILDEYRILKDFSDHPNLPDFYGIYRNKNKDGHEEIWFVMELCEGGSVMDIVRGLQMKNRRMTELHIAFILKETVNALIHLHSHHVIHRNVRGDNILVTRDGAVKLVDFGLAREVQGTLGRRGTCIGSPSWLAPEVVASAQPDGDAATERSYGARADVWALGITAIELGDGKPPFHGMHPTRVMFQIVRNPPPGLYRPGSWSEPYNDFVAECLEKNPDYRPFMVEIFEHPFLCSVPENNYYLTQELKKVCQDLAGDGRKNRQPESIVMANLLQTSQNSKPVRMYLEDLAAIECLSENILLTELKGRMSLGYFQTFIGDVLLILNPNTMDNIYDETYHNKYNLKSRSDNPPHVYTVADRAYQDALHHEAPQHILLAGESGSGKTTALGHLVDHLLFMGYNKGPVGERVRGALELLQAFTNASTPTNHDSTRCVMNTQVTYGSTGKVSGATFKVYQLEKWRVSSTDISQANFHILYYFYDSMFSQGQLNKYSLESDRNYRYLRIIKDTQNKDTRNKPKLNIQRFETTMTTLKALEFTNDQVETMCKVLSAILNLGEIRFSDSGSAEIENPDTCGKVADLLQVDRKKFTWALTNYCFIDHGTAVRKKNTSNQARDARDMLANCLYSRLVDWIIDGINNYMVRTRALFGEKYFVNILDLFGFECYKRNDLEQLIVNTLNEQMQYHYIQRVFAWEYLEQREEEITPTPINYYDNKKAVDKLLGKSGGVLSIIEEASRTGHSSQHVLDTIEKISQGPYIQVSSNRDFYFSHYTGKVSYDVREMTQKNRDFLPPEMIETLRLSSNGIIRELFTNKLSKTGNLIYENVRENKNKWSSALVAEQEKTKKLSSETQYSQTKHMRTAISTFRSVSLQILRELSVGAGAGGTHFIRCVRTDLQPSPKSFQPELVKQQLRALAVLDTARARQQGYPHRISFPEFLRRYKFLAFDFDENVDITKDNCRLLLIRLKMEGWMIGKSKVFLKYYNEEYLSRLYETQVKKIVKIQSMMRAFLAKRSVANKLHNLKMKAAYRGHVVRKKYGPLTSNDSGQLDKETAKFIEPFFKKWKNKSMFQVLLQYRAAKFQDLINLSQQVHIFNQNLMHGIEKSNEEVNLSRIDSSAIPDTWLRERKSSVWKIPFHFDEIPYYSTDHLCDASTTTDDDQETWDGPLQWRQSIINEMKTKDYNRPMVRSPTPVKQNDQSLINLPYIRDPSTPMRRLPSLDSDHFHSTPACSSSMDSPNHRTFNRMNSPSPSYSVSPKPMHSPSYADKHFEGANQDFEFIRSPGGPANKRRTGNPIAELESIGRKIDKSSDDDPPFNFQGMLRKTNFQRNSLKRIPENSYSQEFNFNKTSKNRTNHNNVEFTSTELAPGMVLKGTEIDL